MKTYYALLYCILLTNLLTAQTIRYVRSGGTGNGSSWQNASGILQAMINQSDSTDEVWVAEGVYTPTALIVNPNDNSAPQEERSAFTMKTGVKVLGGFPASGNPGLNDRNPSLHVTILSGDIGIAGDSSDNCYHVVFFPNTKNAVLDGVTVSEGWAKANNSSTLSSYISSLGLDIYNYRGGGIYMYYGSNNITNCVFQNNRSIFEGGAIYSEEGTHQFSNNTFTSNHGKGRGGAVYCFYGTHTFTENTFTNNTSRLPIAYGFPMPSPGDYANGGAIGTVDANITIRDCIFTENNASVSSNVKNAQGGAVFLKQGTHIITNNTFTDNSATYLPTGVQVCNAGALYVEQSNSQITHNEFRENLSHGSAGALGVVQGTHYIANNMFKENEAIGNGGAISCSSTSMDVVNNLFVNNVTNGNGGAIHSAFNPGTNSYVNNTFYGNSSTISNAGGGIYLDSRTDHVLNCIFWNNKVNGSTTASGADVTFYNSGSSSFLNCTNQTSSSPINPLFTDAANGDFSLSSNSPCINTGNNTHFLTSYGNEDFLGNNRINADTIDLGAIEFQGTLPTSLTDYADVSSMQLYPNPAQYSIRVFYSTEPEGDLKVSIRTANGTLEKEVEVDKAGYIDISDVTPGIHIVQVQTVNELKSFKLIKL